MIEGVRGKSYKGDIAIDDVALNDGSCQTLPSDADVSSYGRVFIYKLRKVLNIQLFNLRLSYLKGIKILFSNLAKFHLHKMRKHSCEILDLYC